MQEINRAAELEQFLKERMDGFPYRRLIRDISVNESKTGKSLIVTIIPEGEAVSFGVLNIDRDSISSEAQWKRKKKEVYGTIRGLTPKVDPAFVRRILDAANARLDEWREVHPFSGEMRELLSSLNAADFLSAGKTGLLRFLSGEERLKCQRTEVKGPAVTVEFRNIPYKAVYDVKTGEFTFSLRKASALYDTFARMQKQSGILKDINNYLQEKGIKGTAHYSGAPGRFEITFYFNCGEGKETVNITGTYKRIVSGAYRKAKARAEQREKELERRLKTCPYYGTFIAQAVLEAVRENEGRLTERQIINLLRGVNLSDDYVLGDFSGKFKLLAASEISDAINESEHFGLIRRHCVHGQYQNYYTYRITPEGAFFEKLQEEAVPKKKPVTEQEYLLVLKAVRDDIPRLTDKEKEQLLEAVVDKPGLFLTEPKLVLDCVEQMGEFASKFLSRSFAQKDRRTDREILKLLLKAASGKGKEIPRNGADVFREKAEKARREKEEEERKDKELFRLVLTEIPDNYINLYPEARLMRRQFVLHIGPTNSGKTHSAMEELMQADNGIYLAPLRLLAYEQYERMNRAECPCSLVTGEEQFIIEGAGHQSSTIEMLNLKKHYDVAVIDEAQMISDVSRGGAWAAAIMGVCAEKIHVCAAPEAEKRLVEIIRDCGDDCIIVRHKRMTRLVYEKKPFHFPGDIKPGDALIVFSRRNVHATAAQLRKRHIKCSIIYGALPYDVRHRQAELFASGRTDVVVATDAIGMGMNLPIRRVVLMETEKYDGFERRALRPEEILQIAGRAGRFGIYNVGYVTAANGDTSVRKALERPVHPIENAVIDFPDTLLAIDAPILDLIRKWAQIIPAKGWKKESVEQMLRLARMTERLNAPKRLAYDFLTIPFEDENEELLEIWRDIFRKETWEEDYSIYDQVEAMTILKPSAPDAIDLLEQQHRVLDLYFNLARKFQPQESTLKLIMEKKRLCSERIMEILETRGVGGRQVGDKHIGDTHSAKSRRRKPS